VADTNRTITFGYAAVLAVERGKVDGDRIHFSSIWVYDATGGTPPDAWTS
jgi:hypothetical protein